VSSGGRRSAISARGRDEPTLDAIADCASTRAKRGPGTGEISMRRVLAAGAAAMLLLGGSAEAQYAPPPGYGRPPGYGPPGYYGPPPCPPNNNALKGAAAGAVLGALLGGRKPGKGAAIGATIGGIAGAATRGSKQSQYCR
jgi:hypothetical protein